jgi:hypothetical protein
MMLYKNSKLAKSDILPKEGQPGFLYSNKTSTNGCPSLGFDPNTSKEAALDYLVSILVDAFIEEVKYGNITQQQNNNGQASGDILPGINQRTS